MELIIVKVLIILICLSRIVKSYSVVNEMINKGHNEVIIHIINIAHFSTIIYVVYYILKNLN